MTTRKQIRVFVDDEQWQQFKDEVAYREDNSDTVNRLLTELLKLRTLVGGMEPTEVAQIRYILPELAQIHDNPLVAVGICLGCARQSTSAQAPVDKLDYAITPLAPEFAADDFVDNGEEY
ncbi:MAG: hypothetical protein AAF959_01065 [Cyanobacteria bacterium P01_D01_bin.56]